MNLRTEVRKALRGTEWQALQDLLSEQSRWQRKQTIARNKLAQVREKIDRLANKLAEEKNGVTHDN